MRIRLSATKLKKLPCGSLKLIAITFSAPHYLYTFKNKNKGIMKVPINQALNDSIHFQYSKIYLLNSVIVGMLDELSEHFNDKEVLRRSKYALKATDLVHKQLKPLVDATPNHTSKRVFEDYESVLGFIQRTNFEGYTGNLLTLGSVILSEALTLQKICKKYEVQNQSDVILTTEGSNRNYIIQRVDDLNKALLKLIEVINMRAMTRFLAQWGSFTNKAN